MSRFEETYEFSEFELLHLSVFLVKQYTSLIYVRVNLNFSTETNEIKCFYDISYVRKDLMCKLNHLSDVLPL